MLTQKFTLTRVFISKEKALINTIDTVLVQYQDWKTASRAIHAQLAVNFLIDSGPSEEEVRALLQQFHIFADALRLIADQIEQEVEERKQQYYVWLCD